MKRSLIVLLVLAAALQGPLFAADHTLLTGMWSEAGNLIEVSTPGTLTNVFMPYVEYNYGWLSDDGLSGGSYLSLSTPMNSEPDSIRSVL